MRAGVLPSGSTDRDLGSQMGHALATCFSRSLTGCPSHFELAEIGRRCLVHICAKLLGREPLCHTQQLGVVDDWYVEFPAKPRFYLDLTLVEL